MDVLPKTERQRIYEHVRNYYMSGNPMGYNQKLRSCVYIQIEDEVTYKCAIGCQLDLTPEGWTTLAEDGGGLRDLNRRAIDVIEDVVGRPGTALFNFQCDIQSIHDSFASQDDLDDEDMKDRFIASLDNFAYQQGLEVIK